MSRRNSILTLELMVGIVGGDPKKIAFLANELRRKINDLQDSGWEIDGVDFINNTRAWDSGKQMYVETPEYIIRAKKGFLSEFLKGEKE